MLGDFIKINCHLRRVEKKQIDPLSMWPLQPDHHWKMEPDRHGISNEHDA